MSITEIIGGTTLKMMSNIMDEVEFFFNLNLRG